MLFRRRSAAIDGNGLVGDLAGFDGFGLTEELVQRIASLFLSAGNGSTEFVAAQYLVTAPDQLVGEDLRNAAYEVLREADRP